VKTKIHFSNNEYNVFVNVIVTLLNLKLTNNYRHTKYHNYNSPKNLQKVPSGFVRDKPNDRVKEGVYCKKLEIINQKAINTSLQSYTPRVGRVNNLKQKQLNHKLEDKDVLPGEIEVKDVPSSEIQVKKNMKDILVTKTKHVNILLVEQHQEKDASKVQDYEEEMIVTGVEENIDTTPLDYFGLKSKPESVEKSKKITNKDNILKPANIMMSAYDLKLELNHSTDSYND
jgi:hypothetical protein